MRAGFYPQLAWDGIRKNKRLYFPYILTGSMMVMMYYILSYLIESPAVDEMKGASVLSTVLPLACIVIAVFSLLLLFYSNSFLIRQRYREFGLYNILGMDKRNISKIMVWESIFVFAIVMAVGLVAGIALSKIAELVLLNLLKMDINFDLHLGALTLMQTPLVFGGIYFVLLVNSLIKVKHAKPLALMQSSRVGEHIPKGAWFFGLLGAICLGLAYYLAVNIDEPLTALVWFFIAVLLVIVGTYLLLISGSVAFCKLLQKNKNYYYKPNHFVSVSSMVYRMKRNGAGLASICILLTMVLVMISSTTSLYFGGEDSIQKMYPNNVNISTTFHGIEGIGDDNLDVLRGMIKETAGEDVKLIEYRSCDVPGLFTDDGIIIDSENHTGFDMTTYDNVGYLSVVSLNDYNRLMGENRTLDEKECLIYCERLNYRHNTFTMEYSETYTVKEHLKNFKVDADRNKIIVPTMFLVVKDIDAFTAPVRTHTDDAVDSMITYRWQCGIDTETVEEEAKLASTLYEKFRTHQIEQNELIDQGGMLYSVSIQSREEERTSFYDMYGSLFFLGIMLSIVFLLAAVLIIYFKQISEGYEDYSRFEIMQKVGMTKRDIKKSINSQMLTVFFLPLLLAGVHLAFAFPFVTKIFRLFAFDNLVLSILVNVACFAVFGIFYAIVYKITSNIYYAIVSGRKE